MALSRTSASFVTLAEAEAYFESRLDVAAWKEASEEEKQAALTTAMNVLSSMTWPGVILNDSQILPFPREGWYYEPFVGRQVSLSSQHPIRRLKSAQFEIAYHLLNNDGILDSTGTVKSLTVGSISLTDIRESSSMPNVAYDMLRPLLSSASGGGNNGRAGGMWWRAN